VRNGQNQYKKLDSLNEQISETFSTIIILFLDRFTDS